MLLEKLLSFYPRKTPQKILDATVNGGRFWRESKRRIIGLDIEPRHKPSVAGDNTSMPFRDRSFDVFFRLSHRVAAERCVHVIVHFWDHELNVDYTD